MQCLHLGVLTWVLTDWACPWPSRPSSGGIPTGIRMENTAKSTCFITFLQSELKKPWKTFDFRTFSKQILKKHRFHECFYMSSKQHETQLFFNMFSKILQKHWFYDMFCNLRPKNNENHVFFNMFSKTLQNTQVL